MSIHKIHTCAEIQFIFQQIKKVWHWGWILQDFKYICILCNWYKLLFISAIFYSNNLQRVASILTGPHSKTSFNNILIPIKHTPSPRILEPSFDVGGEQGSKLKSSLPFKSLLARHRRAIIFLLCKWNLKKKFTCQIRSKDYF